MSVNARFDRIAAIVFAMVSIAIMAVASKFPNYGNWETGPAMFPILLGAGIFVFSMLLLLIKPVKKETDDGDEEDKAGPALRSLVAFLCTTTAYVILMPRLGFLFTTPVYVASSIVAMGGKNKWVTVTAVSVLSTLITQYGFLYVFGVKLP
ncbi:MAG TPA: tripartite tricarboxylate transporter TctB family protein [Bacillota bacterium]|nr:tripartite tricarboxylate transporter TctB family protein [Bacillota bacterium]HOA15141.1 tripartite tricarboxylate transporter TctB family protein [Bacillota bacterium]HOG52937.1 tripartite tricarboxylate transporter TctB family protein [Bacillota bacterium]